MKNYALYYPTLEFADYEWLWQASLIWDRIYRIVPEGYVPEDVANVKELCESGEIGAPLDPGRYASEIADEFAEKLDSGDWDAVALVDSDEEDEDGRTVANEFRRIHNMKVDEALREMIVARGDARQVGEWMQAPTELAANYMTFLAVRMAEKNNLQLLSDSTPAWTGATYFQYDGELIDFPDEQSDHQLATLVIRDFLPANILSIPAREIRTFRERFREERQQFLAAVQQSAVRLNQCDDEKIATDLLAEVRLDIETALKDYRSALSYLNIDSMTGIKSLSFPVTTQLATAIGGVALDVSTLLIVSALGAGVGLVSGMSAFGEKQRKLRKECDYSYLLHLEREWKGRGRFNIAYGYNYTLARSLEEFIND